MTQGEKIHRRFKKNLEVIAFLQYKGNPNQIPVKIFTFGQFKQFPHLGQYGPHIQTPGTVSFFGEIPES